MGSQNKSTDFPLSEDRSTLLQNLNSKFSFQDLSLLNRTLTHASFSKESSYETLEFLGDGVLDLVVREYLYRSYPSKDEGELTDWKTRLVNEETLASVAAGMDLGSFLLLGEGEDRNGGREKPSILSGAYEALIGGLYLEGGMEKARPLIQETLLDRVLDFIQERNFKGLFQEFTLKEKGVYPEYRIVKETGKDHEKTYWVEVFVNGRGIGKGEGRNRKEAEMHAAQEALKNRNHKITRD
ncbi:ribonuclease III [candidate division TA06 bacterium]|nr:ribonuclease III [candidate division TA06 bacterium]